MDVVSSPSSTPAPAQTTPAGDGSSTSAPSPSISDAAGTPGNAAPSGNPHREAFDALAKGQEPKAVNRQLFGPAAGGGKPVETAKTPADPAAPRHPPSNDPPQPEQRATSGLAAKFGYPEGTSDKDAQVLKRAQMDAETWSAIPPSNRVKILNNLRATQIAADREFQQRKSGAAPQAGKPGAGATRGAQESPTQTTTDDEDAETLGSGGFASARGEDSDDAQTGDEADPFETEAAPSRAAAGNKGQAAAPASAEDVAAFIDPKDLETLQALGGDDLAQTFTRGIGRVVGHFQQQTGQLLSVAEFLLNQHVDEQFDRGLSRLEAVPGLETIRDEAMTEQRDALRQKADLLHRAAGDPRGYTYQEAMQDAAASLFKTNIHQTAQSRLLQGRTASLKGTTDRAAGRKAEPRALDAKERSRAIFAELARGADPNAARMAVDGR